MNSVLHIKPIHLTISCQLEMMKILKLNLIKQISRVKIVPDFLTPFEKRYSAKKILTVTLKCRNQAIQNQHSGPTQTVALTIKLINKNLTAKVLLNA